MSSFFLSRARLKPDATTAALGPILFDQGRLAPHAGKALMWSLFADRSDRTRDFLWRWEAVRPGRLGGEFLILSARLPTDHHSLFELETRDFAPALAAGERLSFRLRANPVVRRALDGQQRSSKHDIVMDELRHHGNGTRAAARWTAIADAGSAWIRRQLAQCGAELQPDGLRIDGYRQHEVLDGSKPIRFSSLDFDGLLAVTDAGRFVDTLVRGVGAAKAYGCGLMLVKRV